MEIYSIKPLPRGMDYPNNEEDFFKELEFNIQETIDRIVKSIRKGVTIDRIVQIVDHNSYLIMTRKKEGFPHAPVFLRVQECDNGDAAFVEDEETKSSSC